MIPSASSEDGEPSPGSGIVVRLGVTKWPGPAWRLSLSIILLTLLMLLALFIGRYPTAGIMSFSALRDDPVALRVILLIRLPRIILAALTGAVLGASGCVFQLVFSNALVDAGFLGVSQGAAFGAALAMVLGLGAAGLYGLAFCLSMAALMLSVFMAERIRFGGAVLRLVLSGIAVSAFFSALVALVKYTADPLKQLPDIAYWMMGGLSGASWATVRLVAPGALLSVSTLVLLRWRTTLLSLDEATAVSLGVRPRLERALVLSLATFGVASVTAAAGIVSWVGLIMPHMSRLILGSDGASSISGSAILGACFVVLCDTLARTIFAGEIPLGIGTALLGTTLFFALLLSRRLRFERG